MHGQIETSFLPRWTVMVIHTLTVGVIVWLLTGGQDLLPETFRQADPYRRALIAVFAVVYLVRTLFGMLVLLKRHFGWVETLIVLAIFMSSHAIFAGLALANPQLLSWWGGLAAAVLFLLGSWLNTASEYQRFLWKRRPENRGRAHTGGLFRYAAHINYFGDTVMFSGYALATGSLWAFAIPAYMTAGFIFQHIPNLDAYLSKKYGAEFDDYAARTKKLIPFVY